MPPAGAAASPPSLRMAHASVYAVASVSAPAKARSETRQPLSAPRAMASRSASAAWGGPMETTVTVPPCFSLMRTASSIA